MFPLLQLGTSLCCLAAGICLQLHPATTQMYAVAGTSAVLQHCCTDVLLDKTHLHVYCSLANAAYVLYGPATVRLG